MQISNNVVVDEYLAESNLQDVRFKCSKVKDD